MKIHNTPDNFLKNILIELKKKESKTINELKEFLSLKKQPSKESARYITAIYRRQEGRGISPALDGILSDLQIIYSFEELKDLHVIPTHSFKDNLDKIEYLSSKLDKYQKGASFNELPPVLYKTEIKYFTFRGNKIEGNVLYRGAGSFIFKAKDKDEYYLDAVYASSHMLASKSYQLDNKDINLFNKKRNNMLTPLSKDKELEKFILELLVKYHH